ncbi:hypothetical protein LMG26684_01741 [Achromobacter mucicolens]|uniref:DUF2242 domain-containing protein n=1 Tax=Achromobacter mucicolens TaxID=1389922 RepID=UPI0014668A69|nr:DUF2242 domain-containing protein [Achromobacter mucicolens]CAB3844292.1 hypothetical protein LMG26684_01741 [Achromobacter mucicolens]
MPRATRRIVFPLFATLTAVLAGCSSPKPVYEREDFAQSDTYSRSVPAASSAACDAGRRALLSQGYNIDKYEPSRVTGHKNFEGEDGQHTQISFNVECAPDGSTHEGATVFANAVQDRYSTKRTGNSASVGVSVLGQVSMPFGGSDDSLVKTASQTVTRPKFYDGFFQLLERYLPDAKAAAAPREPSARPKGAASKSAASPATAPAQAPADPVVAPDAPADTLNPAAAGGDKPAPATAPATSAPAAKTPASGEPAAAGTPAAGSPAAGSPAAGSPAAGSPAAESPAAAPAAAGSPAEGAPAPAPASQTGN